MTNRSNENFALTQVLARFLPADLFPSKVYVHLQAVQIYAQKSGNFVPTGPFLYRTRQRCKYRSDCHFFIFAFQQEAFATKRLTSYSKVRWW